MDEKRDDNDDDGDDDRMMTDRGCFLGCNWGFQQAILIQHMWEQWQYNMRLGTLLFAP